MGKRTSDERRIMEMFTYMRPAGSDTERAFVDRFLIPLGFRRDEHRNLVLQIGDDPTILWSSHMDTVHFEEGRQTLHYDGTMLSLSRKAANGRSSCLGADDTAGMWLMTEMVRAGVPGLYIIHHAEEIGGHGSGDLADKNPERLAGIAAAIAFDRAGYDSVITHQGSRGASDAFARSLAGILGGGFKPDSGGIFTDTANYTDLIGECTNISVGYFKAHRSSEYQDVGFLIALRDRLLAADFSTLVFERMPGEVDLTSRSYGGYGRYRYTGEDTWKPPVKTRRYETVADLIGEYPEVVEAILEAYGVNETILREQITDFYGNVFDDGRYDDHDDEREFDEPRRAVA